jgi:hypothetical protein
MKKVLFAADGTKVILGTHALERMVERDIDLSLVQFAINNGELRQQANGNLQWVATFDAGRSRILLAVLPSSGHIFIPTLMIRGRLDNGA